MTYQAAVGQLIDIVKDTTPAVRLRGLPSSFRHTPEADTETIPDSRSFSFALSEGSVRGIYAGLRYRKRARVALSIWYKDGPEIETLDSAIDSDHSEIATRLLTPANWAQSTSGIVTLSLGEEELMPFQLLRGEGFLQMMIRFPMEYTT